MGLLRSMYYSAENVVQISQLHADWNWCFNSHVLAHLETDVFCHVRHPLHQATTRPRRALGSRACCSQGPADATEVGRESDLKRSEKSASSKGRESDLKRSERSANSKGRESDLKRSERSVNSE